MKQVLTTLLALLAFVPLWAQLNEQFNDGNFNANPTWQGDTVYWQITNGQLNSKGPAITGTQLHLSTISNIAMNVVWECYVNPKLATSSGNYMDVFLISNLSDLEGSNEGYFVRIGGTSDEVSLFLKKGSIITKIIDGNNGIIASNINNPTRVKISRSKEGEFMLFADTSGTGMNYIEQGSVLDNSITESSFFGVLIRYSSANASKFFFDDFLISRLEIDTVAPELISCKTLSDTSLQIVFSEPMKNSEALNKFNYSASNGIGYADTVVRISADTFIVCFSESFTSGKVLELEVNNVSDLEGNLIKAGSVLSFSYRAPYLALWHDVIINELLPDPYPPLDLPEVEFMELFNTTELVIQLNGWKLNDLSGEYFFGKNDSIQPGSYLILCAIVDTNLFSAFGEVLGMSNWLSLNNASDALKLWNSKGNLIDSVSYTDKWYADPNKKEGGYSLERIKTGTPCKDEFNWMASADPSGGTLGRMNSINGIGVSEFLIKKVAYTQSTIEIFFNSAFDNSVMSDYAHYRLEPGNLFPDSIAINDELFKVTLFYTSSFKTDLNYQLNLEGLTNCMGKELTDVILSFRYNEPVHTGEILINEVLFNPLPEGVDFVELYNHSERIIELNNLAIGNISDKGILSSVKKLPDSLGLFYPGEYRVLSLDSEAVLKQYFSPAPDKFIAMPMPSFNDDKGTVMLLRSSDSLLIDRFDYSEDMHFSGLADREGVSLERISPDRPTAESGNWHSASSASGFASPAAINSQVQLTAETDASVQLEPQAFSPDNDGHDDVLAIHYRNELPGALAKIIVYDARGIKVKVIASNDLLAYEGVFYWDGTTEENSIAPVGMYIIYVEQLYPDGELKKTKKVCVLAKHLD